MGRNDDPLSDPDALLAAYRKSLRTVIGHAVFFVLCCTIAIIVRRMFNMPPALLSVVFIVALILFGGDIMRFLSFRRRVRRLRESRD